MSCRGGHVRYAVCSVSGHHGEKSPRFSTFRPSRRHRRLHLYFHYYSSRRIYRLAYTVQIRAHARAVHEYCVKLSSTMRQTRARLAIREQFIIEPHGARRGVAERWAVHSGMLCSTCVRQAPSTLATSQCASKSARLMIIMNSRKFFALASWASEIYSK